MRGKSILIFSFILVVSLSFVSAGWFSDLFETTGEVTNSENQELNSIATGFIFEKLDNGVKVLIENQEVGEFGDAYYQSAIWFRIERKQWRQRVSMDARFMERLGATFEFDRKDDTYIREMEINKEFYLKGIVDDANHINEANENDNCVEQKFKAILDSTGSLIGISPISEPYVCKEKLCFETDGGIDYYNKGSVLTNSGYTREDFCRVDGKLGEVFCNPYYGGVLTQFLAHDCPYGCSDGACIVGEDTALEEINKNEGAITIEEAEKLRTQEIAIVRTEAVEPSVNEENIEAPIAEESTEVIPEAIETIEIIEDLDIIEMQEGLEIEEVIETPETIEAVENAIEQDSLEKCTDTDARYSEASLVKGSAEIKISIDSDEVKKIEDSCRKIIISEDGIETYSEVESCEEDCALYESFCKVDSLGKESLGINIFNCFNGCLDGACIESETEIINEESQLETENIIEEVGTVEVESQAEKVFEIADEFIICNNGCSRDKKCYDFGYRKSGEFCSDSEDWIIQQEAETMCENNFECSSNLCVDLKCVSASNWRKIIAWFGRIF